MIAVFSAYRKSFLKIETALFFAYTSFVILKISNLSSFVTNVEITDNNNYLNTWISYDSNQWGYYSFSTNGNAYTAPISVKITKTNNAISETIIAYNLISLSGDETFDFGSNFCQTISPTKTPSKTPTVITTIPTTTPSISPTNLNMPYFVSYVGQIGPGKSYSYNAILLSNLLSIYN